MLRLIAALVLVAAFFAFARAEPPIIPILDRCVNGGTGATTDERIRACTLVVEAKGQEPEAVMLALSARADLYRERREYDKAIADFDKMLALDPSDDDAVIGRANTFAEKGDLARALAELDVLIARKPNFAQAYCARGNVYYAKGDRTRALADCTRGIELDPKNAYGWLERSYLYRLLGDRDRELSDLSRAIELEPDDPQLRHRRALIFMLRREHARAIADYDRIIAVKPDANAYLFRGGAHLYSGNYDQAIADAEHAINLDPGNAVARDLLREASKKKAEAQTRS